MKFYITLLRVLIQQVDHRDRITLFVSKLIVIECHIVKVTPTSHRLDLFPVEFAVFAAAPHLEEPLFISAAVPIAQAFTK